MQTRIVMPVLITCLFMLPFQLVAKSIFVVDSYHAGFVWTEKCRQGFDENIYPRYKVTYHEMDTKRIHPDQFAERADSIWQKIIAEKPDLVVTMDDNALMLLGQRIADAGFPLVFMGVNNNPRSYFEDGEIPPKVTGIMEHPLLKQNIVIISKLLPMKNHRVLLMTDKGTTSNSYIDLVLKAKSSVTIEGINVDIVQFSDYPKWQEKVRSLSPDMYDALIIGSYAAMKNGKNQPVSSKAISKWTSANSAVPMFTFWFHDAGKGKAVGGNVISGHIHGASAASAANIILKSGKIPYLKSPRDGQLLFSKSELSRWDISLPDYIKNRCLLIE
ncbi:hypothetical protein L3Q72_22370 [Vibrio sp. JC009]|uniref:ABC transporter substrate-binding protein n=1 Tax=Vibrio sp. JC009 TaxID=2912314 RepID=UPI0023AF654A|nr:hypothetical protein [Vibrio sp. JC009]WED23978.1 hypothetical protein L3Q72_22370 [Vibrio sp. JC009]